MKIISKLIFCVVSLLFSLSLIGLVFTQDNAICDKSDSSKVCGRKIMNEVDKLKSPKQMFSETTTLIVKGDKDNPIIKRSKTYQKKYSGDITKRLTVTTYPNLMKILSYSYKNKDDDMWIKLSSGNAKRISGSGKQGYIQNSHLRYEDIESHNLDDYEFTYQGVKMLKVEGRRTKCYKIQSQKISGEESAYKKTDVYIRVSDLFTVRTDMWDKNGNPHKTERALEIKKFYGDNDYTIAVKTGVSLIDDPQTTDDEGKNQYTITEMNNIKVDNNIDIDESLFRKDSM